MSDGWDFIVIGAGIAGASAAAELAPHARVLLLERESQPGYHTTGRSAALFTEAYGPPVIRALSRASAPFFRDPQSPHLDHPLLHDRGVIFVGREDQMDKLSAMRAELGEAVIPLTAAQTRERAPLLRESYVAGGLYEDGAADIDVGALHQHYLKAFKAAGGELSCRAEVLGLTRTAAGWDVETPRGVFQAPVVINAAGAWADEMARLAGAAPGGLSPLRRTALIVAAPEGVAPDPWPMVVDADEEFYMKPDAGKLLISPADETPSAPCDAQPDEMDVAVCVDRIETAFDLQVRRIDARWAGLRSFLPDGSPAVGFDADAPGFFWLAGQGGYGIQTAPAMGRTAAALAMGRAIPADIQDQGVDQAALAPSRKGLAA